MSFKFIFNERLIKKIIESQKHIKMSDKIIKKNQFQIRKVPIKRFAPQKVPQLYALDIHSICLPKKQKKNIDWASINCDGQKLYDQDYNDKIIYSQTYQLLYSKYSAMKQQRQKQKQLLQEELDAINQKIENEKTQKTRLTQVRDKFYNQIEELREELTECRNKSYNLRWQIYHQRGTYFVNATNYSFLDSPDATYEDYLLLQQQMGIVPRGLNEIQLALLPKTQYTGEQLSFQAKKQSQNPQTEQKTITKQICCICYDQINKGEYITILKCKHVHHCDCIKDWLVKQKNCPICKKEVVLDEFHLKKDSQTKKIAQ